MNKLKSCDKKRAWFILALLFALMNIRGQEGYCQEAELIWLETEDTMATIYYAKYGNNNWSSKQVVATRKGLMLTPSIASIDESRMAVWVTVDDQASLSLGYSIGKNGKWLASEELNFGFQEATAPVLIVFNHTYYLFFAGNSQDDDDIYMSLYVNNYWTEPVMVHPDNNVPDILPQPSFADGALTLTWQHFNGNRYIYSSQKIVGPLSLPLAKDKFQGQNPKEFPRRTITWNNPKILKDKFQIDLPADFKGVGLARGYMQSDTETPAIYFTTGSY